MKIWRAFGLPSHWLGVRSHWNSHNLQNKKYQNSWNLSPLIFCANHVHGLNSYHINSFVALCFWISFFKLIYVAFLQMMVKTLFFFYYFLCINCILNTARVSLLYAAILPVLCRSEDAMLIKFDFMFSGFFMLNWKLILSTCTCTVKLQVLYLTDWMNTMWI